MHLELSLSTTEGIRIWLLRVKSQHRGSNLNDFWHMSFSMYLLRLSPTLVFKSSERRLPLRCSFQVLKLDNWPWVCFSSQGLDLILITLCYHDLLFCQHEWHCSLHSFLRSRKCSRLAKETRLKGSAPQSLACWTRTWENRVRYSIPTPPWQITGWPWASPPLSGKPAS